MIKAISVLIIPILLCIIMVFGLCKKTPIYETFVEGAKEGFGVGVKIIPYLVAIMVAIGMFRASGAIEWLATFVNHPMVPPDAIPIMIVRSLSGSAALGVFSDVVATHGADAYVTKLCAVILGSSETTFYVLAVYFGAVGIKKFRHALLVGVLADVIGIVCAIFVTKWFFA